MCQVIAIYGVQQSEQFINLVEIIPLKRVLLIVFSIFSYY